MADRSTGRGAHALLAFLLSSFGVAAAGADSAPPPASRGELLYSNHCIECHNAEIHWRDRRLARDWSSLETQVDRWQRAARLEWTSEDIRDVTEYLGVAVYHLAPRRPTAAIRIGTLAE